MTCFLSASCIVISAKVSNLQPRIVANCIYSKEPFFVFYCSNSFWDITLTLSTIIIWNRTVRYIGIYPDDVHEEQSSLCYLFMCIKYLYWSYMHHNCIDCIFESTCRANISVLVQSITLYYVTCKKGSISFFIVLPCSLILNGARLTAVGSYSFWNKTKDSEYFVHPYFEMIDYLASYLDRQFSYSVVGLNFRLRYIHEWPTLQP